MRKCISGFVLLKYSAKVLFPALGDPKVYSITLSVKFSLIYAAVIVAIATPNVIFQYLYSNYRRGK